MDDNFLIEKLKLKDENAFKEFIDLYQKKIVNLCFKFVYDRHDAEDIAQDVFIEDYLSINRFKMNSRISTWLYRIAVNKSLDFIKKKNRKKRFVNASSIFGLSLNEEKSIKINATPLTILELSERKQILIKAINSLPENQKTAITLAKLEGLSYQEISEILRTSPSAVDSLIQRAKQNLKKYLSSEDY